MELSKKQLSILVKTINTTSMKDLVKVGVKYTGTTVQGQDMHIKIPVDCYPDYYKSINISYNKTKNIFTFKIPDTKVICSVNFTPKKNPPIYWEFTPTEFKNFLFI